MFRPPALVQHVLGLGFTVPGLGLRVRKRYGRWSVLMPVPAAIGVSVLSVGFWGTDSGLG